MGEAASRQTVIGPDARIRGEVSFEGPARILGHVEGTIASTSEVHVGSGAVCAATIDAESVTVEGEVTGNVSASNQIQLGKTALLRGDISAGTLVVVDGASFVGHCRIGGPASQHAQERPGASGASSNGHARPAPEVATRPVRPPATGSRPEQPARAAVRAEAEVEQDADWAALTGGRHAHSR